MNNPVPDRWSVKSIGDLVTLQYGKSPKDIFNEDGEYPVIGTGGVTGFTSSYLHEGDTTVIGRKGTINKPSYAEGRFWAIDTTYFGDHYRDADPKWFYYSLNSFDLAKYNEASGVPSLNRDTLNAIQLLTPPLPEQQKIATILSSVDDVIEKTRAQIDKLKELKTGMMQELLTKGIGHTEFKDSPVGRIPTAWEIVELSNIVCSNRPITYGIVQTGAGSSNGVPCVRVVDLMQTELSVDNMIRTSQKISQQYKRTILQKGDIMFALRGEIGRVRKVESPLIGANLTRGIALISPSSKVSTEYLLWALRSSGVRKIIMDGVNGSALQEIPLGNLRNVKIPLPPTPEQNAMARKMDSIESILGKTLKKLDAVNRIKKALMQDLLTGKVRVNTNQRESVVA